MPLPKMKAPDYEVHTYPPTGFIDKKKALEGHSWADFGNANGKTAWDIIFFNFRTFTPEEVNWYMWHYLGRTKLASDGKNLTFGTDPSNASAALEPPKRFRVGDTPWVYIPPASFKAPSANDEKLRLNVRTTLSGPTVADIHFRIGTSGLFAGELVQVRDHIAARRIAVRHDPALHGIAKYVHTNGSADRNTLKAGFTEATSVLERALIVHEAVHAAFDIRGSRTRLTEAEGIAYVAQAIYLIKHNQLPHHVDLPAAEKRVFTTAEQVATFLIGLETPPRASIVELRNAIAAVYPAGQYRFDGVP